MKHLVKHLTANLRRRWEDERGVALVVAAGSMIALTSAVALAIDVGMLTVARGEAQASADAAALAGASGLIDSPDLPALARIRAQRFANANTVRGDAPVVRDEDIDVDLDARTVTVRVLRSEDRGNAVGTFFARIFGVNQVNITVDATARASWAGGINCLLPLVIPDRWRESTAAGNDPDTFDPDLGDEYIPWMDASTDPPTYNTDSFTGYTSDDIGSPIVLTSNEGGGTYNSSWYYPWRPEEQMGADDFRENVRNCVDPTLTHSVGQLVDNEPGNMAGPTNQGFKDLIDLDPLAVWNDTMDCITDAAHVLSADASHCRNTPRVRPIPMFDPREGPANGLNEFEFTNFAGVFIEGQVGKTVIARFVGYRGLDPVTDQSAAAGPQFKVVQLID